MYIQEIIAAVIFISVLGYGIRLIYKPMRDKNKNCKCSGKCK